METTLLRQIFVKTVGYFSWQKYTVKRLETVKVPWIKKVCLLAVKARGSGQDTCWGQRAWVAAVPPCPLSEAGEHKRMWHSLAPNLNSANTKMFATALLKSTGTAFLKSEGSKGAPSLTFSSCLTTASECVQSTEEISLDCLALVAKRAGIQSNMGM